MLGSEMGRHQREEFALPSSATVKQPDLLKLAIEH